MVSWQNLLNIIPIAVVISIIVFLVKFFGKIIADHVPFIDKRAWHEEMSGVMFFVYRIATPIILLFILYTRNWNPLNFTKIDWILFIAGIISYTSLYLAIIWSFYFFSISTISNDNFSSFFKLLFNKNARLKEGHKLFITKQLILPLSSFSILVIILFLYKWQAFYHFSLALIYLFVHLIGCAIILSIKKENILLADICFIEPNEKDIKNCRIIKVNEDNIRVKTNENNIIILNKSVISKIEIMNKKYEYRI